ncbi:phage late control D family protein [Orbus mooreae]|uniref:phage late control D family protein n=1 Tax=Orbus mooreae TaxID=3074107 RepID=UPI00370D6305
MINFIENNVRKCTLRLIYENKDITYDVSDYIESFSFTERAKNGESDDISITFRNNNQEWSNNWFPQRGAKISAKIITENWNNVNDAYVLDCGSFEIDEINDQGPPSTITIGALSVGISSSLRGQSNSKAWENFRFSKIVSELAKKHQFGVFFDCRYDPLIDRFDQKNESDLSFLLNVAEYIGVNLRIAKNKIIVYEEALYDNKTVSFSLTKNNDGYINHSFRASSADIYSACHVQFLDSSSSKLMTYQYNLNGSSGILGEKASGGNIKIDPVTRMVISEPVSTKKIEAPKVGKILKINRRCKSLTEAESLAKSMLRGKNKRELSGSLTFFGNLYLRAGLTLSLNQFGVWDGAKWVIDEVSHSYSKSSGLETAITIRGALDY